MVTHGSRKGHATRSTRERHASTGTGAHLGLEHGGERAAAHDIEPGAVLATDSVAFEQNRLLEPELQAIDVDCVAAGKANQQGARVTY